MRRDRDGSELVDDPATEQHVCQDGWVGEDQDGRPWPCPICRADTIRIRARRRAVLV